MKHLADISCDKTIILVNRWFNHFTTNLIMKDLSEYEGMQLQYLETFIKENK